MDESSRLSAYVLYYWPISYAQVRFSLEASGILPLRDAPPEGRPFRVLDLGSGPGPAGVAVADALREAYPGHPVQIVALDRSALALEVAERIATGKTGRHQGKTHDEEMGITFKGFHGWDAQVSEPDELPAGPFDVVVASHLFNEINDGSDQPLGRRTGLAEAALNRRAEGGIFLLLEPALLSTSREAIALRDALVAEGHSLRWPCPWRGPCHAIERPGGTCHMEFSWSPPPILEELAKRTGLDRGTLKTAAFTFGPPSDANPYRVVSEGLLNKAGRTRLVLCGQEGRTVLSAKRGEGFSAEGAFFKLRRGDALVLEAPIHRESGLALGENTRIRTLSTLPREGAVDGPLRRQ